VGTRVIIGGRTQWATRDIWAKRPPLPASDPDKAAPVVDPLVRTLKVVGVPFYDQEDDLHYRVVAYLDPRAGWCLATQLCELYRVSYLCLLDWCRRGHVEPAMEKGSPTKRFKARDHAALLKLAAAWREKQPPARTVPVRRPLAEVRAEARATKRKAGDAL